jgi:hypothetical protein
VPRKPVIPVDLATRPFHFEEARRHGLSKYNLDGLSWTRLGGGYYAAREIADNPLVRLTAAMHRLPDTAAFSGHTAAWLHGFDYPACSPIEALVPLASRLRRIRGISIHRCADYEASFAKGLPVTSRLRTFADLGRRLPLVEAVAAIDMALHRRAVSTRQLIRWIATHPGYRGISVLRRAIELAEPATESPMETRLRLLLVLAGLPKPKVQVSLRDENGIFIARPDLYYPTKRLAIEYDGASHRTSIAADNRRQNRLLEAGHRLLRFSASDVMQTPMAVVGLVRRALAS